MVGKVADMKMWEKISFTVWLLGIPIIGLFGFVFGPHILPVFATWFVLGFIGGILLCVWQ